MRLTPRHIVEWREGNPYSVEITKSTPEKLLATFDEKYERKKLRSVGRQLSPVLDTVSLGRNRLGIEYFIDMKSGEAKAKMPPGQEYGRGNLSKYRPFQDLKAGLGTKAEGRLKKRLREFISDV